MRFHQNPFRRTEGDQLREDFPQVAALAGARVEFAVGKSAGTALAKTVVGFGIDLLFLVECRHVHFARVHIFSPLQNDRTPPLHQQAQRSEHPGRTTAYHKHGFRSGHVAIFGKGKLFQGLAPGHGLDTVTVKDFAPGVQGAADNTGLRHAVGLYAQGAGRCLAQFFIRRLVPDGKGDVEFFHERSPYSAARESGAISSGANRPA